MFLWHVPMPKYFSYSFGLSDLAPTSAPSKKSHFENFWMRWNPTQPQDTILGSYLLLPTHPNFQLSILFALHTYPLTSYFFLLFSLLSPFLTHNLFFFLCDLFIVIYFSSFFGFPFPFFCLCVCVCVELCVEPWKRTRVTKRGGERWKRGTISLCFFTFFCLCVRVCVCVELCVEPWKRTRVTKMGGERWKRGTTWGATRRNESLTT